MATATAYLDTVRMFNAQHPVEADRVAALVLHVIEAGRWDLPPILVVEDEGNGATILDGHHRAAAMRELLGDPEAAHLVVYGIPAYIVTVADYCAILEEYFDGCTPDRLLDLDDYILIDGAPYAARS